MDARIQADKQRLHAMRDELEALETEVQRTGAAYLEAVKKCEALRPIYEQFLTDMTTQYEQSLANMTTQHEQSLANMTTRPSAVSCSWRIIPPSPALVARQLVTMECAPTGTRSERASQ